MSLRNGRDYDYHIVNNIFYSSNDSLEVFYFTPSELDGYGIPIIQYNCFWGHGYLLPWRCRSQGYELELDSTNLFLDPALAYADSITPYLTWESPCIDAGDPDSPEDPDGSRADMGAFWFDHDLLAEPAPTTLIPHPSAFILSSVYPNPFNSHLSIDLNASLPVQVSVYDPLGRVVKTGRYHQRHINLSFDHSLPSGMYLVELRSGNRTSRQTVAMLR